MTITQKLNAFGLVLSMLGVLVIFIYGPPQPEFTESVSIVLEDATPLPDGRTAAEHGQDARRLKNRYAALSKIGLGLVFFGFALQLVAVFVVPAPD